MKKLKRLFVIGVLPESLINFRWELLKDFVQCDYEVHALSAYASNEVVNYLQSIGINHHGFSVQRNGLNPIKDLKMLIQLYRITRRENPYHVFAYTIKPVIWGGIVARLLGCKFTALITGLGFAFQGDTFKRKLLTRIVSFLYRIALKSAHAVIFQNTDNRNEFVRHDIVPVEKTHIVAGSGVDIVKFELVPLPEIKPGELVFLCVARLLGDKGLREYATAAKYIKTAYPKAEFLLVGPEETSPDKISLDEVNEWVKSGVIKYVGATDDVRTYIRQAHVYVLPSYHEGMPRSTLEAMSMGRPVITTHAVGCNETVDEGINGFKVPVGDSDTLAERMIWCIENQEILSEFGLVSRKIVEEKFDVHKVNAHILKIMGLTKC